METNRRKWLKQIGLVVVGVGLARLKTIASPIVKTDYFIPGADDKVVRISSNENPYGPSLMARTAMADTINMSNRYQWEMIRELMRAIAAKNNLAYENVLVGAGSTQMIDMVLQLAAAQKGNIVLADPTFSRWTNAAEQSGLQKIPVPLTKDKRHNLGGMLSAINADTRMVYVCNPNNPTGTICNYEDLVSFIKAATKRVLVLVDEAYLDYSDEKSLSSLVTGNENLIVVKTFSKIYGMAGARVGYALAHAKTIEKLGALQSGANIGISVVSLAGALASLKDHDFVKDSFSRNETVRAYTIEQLERLNISCIPSHSNFIYFSLANYKKDFFAVLKTNNIEGTAVFEEDGKWSRITVGTMEEMKRFIASL